MAPSSSESKPAYAKDEKALCFHGELLYEAKILDVRRIDQKDKTSPFEYRVHYKGWKNTWDDWVPQDRLRKNTEENRELAINLKKASQEQNAPKVKPLPLSTKNRKRAGSDLDSGRGSIARDSSVSVPAGGGTGRGTKRGRDNDIEKVEQHKHALLTMSPLRRTGSIDFKTDLDLTAYVQTIRENTKTIGLPSVVERAQYLEYIDGRHPSHAQLVGLTADEVLTLRAPLDPPQNASHSTALDLQPPQDKAALAKRFTEYRETEYSSVFAASSRQSSRSRTSFRKTASIQPLHVFPPGSGGPYDALHFPDRILEILERPFDDQTREGWTQDAILKIPLSVLNKLSEEGKANLPDAVQTKTEGARNDDQMLNGFTKVKAELVDITVSRTFKAPSLQSNSSSVSTKPPPKSDRCVKACSECHRRHKRCTHNSGTSNLSDHSSATLSVSRSPKRSHSTLDENDNVSLTTSQNKRPKPDFEGML